MFVKLKVIVEQSAILYTGDGVSIARVS